jgi:hypothetical protein
LELMGPIDEPQSNVDSVSPVPSPSPVQPPAFTESPAQTPAAPEPTPTPTVTPEPTADPAIAATVTIPADADASGGEWDLLKDKLQGLVNTDQLHSQWSQLKGPLRLLAGLIVLVIVLQIYGGILRTIDALPLASGLFELAGVIWLGNFSVRNLVRSGDRRKVLEDLVRLWQRVVGG